MLKSAIMTNEEILREIDSLPVEARRRLEDFVTFLRERYRIVQSSNDSIFDLESEAFVGMWRDREDMNDSSAWVRNVRGTHWSSK